MFIIFVIECDDGLSLENCLVEIFDTINKVLFLSNPYQDCLSFLSSSSSSTEAILVVIVDCLQDQT